MLCFNRGEWSEIYTVLYLLANPRIRVVDSNLNFVNDNIFEGKSISLKSSDNISYQVKGDAVYRLNNNNKQCEFSKFEIQSEVQ